MDDRKIAKIRKILIIKSESDEQKLSRIGSHSKHGSLFEKQHCSSVESNHSERMLILVVDPSKEMVQEYKSILGEEKYDLRFASSITEAVKELKKTSFDCVIVDVDLPDMAGYDAVSVIKSMEPKVSIIITSTKNTKELEARIRKEDILYYYIKSFDREELKLAIESALARGGREAYMP